MLLSSADARRADLAPLFATNRPSYLIAAILEGRMGSVSADRPHQPTAAMLRLGELAFFGGDPHTPSVPDWLASLEPVVGVWPPEPAWLPALKSAPGHRLVHQERWSLSSDNLEPDLLAALAQGLPSHLALVPIDLALADRIPEELETNNQILNYGSAKAFMAQGFGHALLHDKRIAAAVSTFANCAYGVEIQINVHSDYRRRGIATGLAAHFVLDCLARGLDPHWDAGNAASRSLAEKLGYTKAESYVMPILVPDEA